MEQVESPVARRQSRSLVHAETRETRGRTESLVELLTALGGAPRSPRLRVSSAFLLPFSLSLLLLASLIGCSSEKPASSSKVAKDAAGADAAPSSSNEPIVISIPADATKLDPPQPTDGTSLTIIEHLYDRLVDFAQGPEVKIVPALATTWTVSPDGLVYTFNLRTDATFADGTPVTSAAVKYTFERITNTSHPEHFGINWTENILGEWFDRIEAPDDQTVVFHLHRPFVPMLANLAMPSASIVNPAHIKAMGADNSAARPMGSGAYELEEWKRGAYLKLKARPNHWRGRPKTDTLFWRVQADMNQALSALRKGETHVVLVLSPSVVGEQDDQGEGRIVRAPMLAIGHVYLNVKKAPLESKELRLALNYAVDREALCNGLLRGSAFPASGVIPPGMLGHREDKPFGFTYDPEKARALLKQAGFENGVKLSMHCFAAPRPYNTAGLKTAQRLQEDWRKVGIDVELEQMEFGAMLEVVSQRTEHQMALLGWMADTGDPDNFIWELYGVPTNRSNYENVAANELMKQAAAELDPAKRAELYHQAEDLILQDPPAVFLNHAHRIRGVSKRLRGFDSSSLLVDSFGEAYLVEK